jgi:O-antigen/teichoic acid export membrane protein
MNTSSRTINSFRNTLIGITAQIINIILSFITRTVFIKYLSIEYLGVNGLFTNILTVLSLAELGFGTAMIYSLYKPLAQNDYKSITALMNFYSKVYKIIGFAIGILGLALIPALDIIIKDQLNIEHLSLIYVLFLANSITSYFFAYKRSIIITDQRDYILSQYKLYFSIIKALLQILVIVLTKSFIIYLLVQIFSVFAENFFVSLKADKLYPYLKTNKQVKLEKTEKKSIWNNVKALMIYKLGSTVLDGTDNIIISAFLGVIWVGKLSNYTLIVGSLSMIVLQFTNAIAASVGNFIVKESEERQESLLKTITFANFIICGFSFVCLYILINPFIYLWIGSDYLLSQETVFIISFNWYIFGMMNSIWTFRATMGLFVYGKYRPAISAIINVIVSILLAKPMGLFGVLLGTTITRFTTNVWYDPLVVYKYGLQKSVKSYYYIWLKYLAVVLVDIALISYISGYLPVSTITTFVIQMIICVVFTPITFLMIFGRTEEFKYLYKMAKMVATKNKR